jgi:hypothetical protein
MSHKGKKEHLESCRPRYPSRNWAGKSTMVDDVRDTLGCRDLDDPELKLRAAQIFFCKSG